MAIRSMPSSSSTSQRRNVARVARVLLALGLILTPSITGSVSADEGDRKDHPTGIELVGPEVMQPTPVNEAQAQAISDALQFAMNHRDDVGYPWVDDAGEVLELSFANARGEAALRGVGAAMATPHRIREVRNSFADLERVRHEVTLLRDARVPGADHIYMTEPDWKHGRIIVTVDALNDQLLADLTRRFGTDSIAVRVDPDIPKAVADDARNNDFSPFSGGGHIEPSDCSNAFAWSNGSLWEGMLTAAHCHPTNGVAVQAPNQTMGTIAYNNWAPMNGTVPYAAGQPNRGDVALIKLHSNRDSHPRMFRGTATSTTVSTVRLVWGRWSLPGDDYCFSGRASGEICTFDVTSVGVDIYYWNYEAWARNMVHGHKLGTCTTGGDSGGAIFTIYGTGVAAKGVHSGAAVIGPSCDNYFTDIQHPVQALPGGVQWQP